MRRSRSHAVDPALSRGFVVGAAISLPMWAVLVLTARLLMAVVGL